MWAQVWNIILLVILLTMRQVPTGEEEMEKKKSLANHAYQNDNKNVKTLQKEKE